MVFNSLTFVLFFTVVLTLHSLPLSWRARKAILWQASYLFYAAWNPPFVILLWVSTLADWLAGQRLHRAQTPIARKFWLVFSLTVNLGLLGFFKYGTFLLENFVALLGMLNIAFQPAAPDIVLPVGISFYTFQSMSYTLDIYKGKLRPWPSFVDFALYVTFFPQLVAGPIVRAVDFLPQLKRPRRIDANTLGWGLTLLTLGLFQKVILADSVLAPVVERVYGAVPAAGLGDAWIGTLAFSGQIFFDFAGYSTCAIGAARCLGFTLTENFRYPYAAVGFTDFWRRWHMSLSSWLRDYLYIPLGGNRKGAGRTYVNLMVTMLLGGLWHGAAWRFVIWGGLHGLFLAIERWIKNIRPVSRHRTSPQDTGWRHFGLALPTYLAICLTWVFFRAADFQSAWTLIGAMFGFSANAHLAVLPVAHCGLVLGITILLLTGHWMMRERGFEALWRCVPWRVQAVALAGTLAALAFVQGENRAFIYFQF